MNISTENLENKFDQALKNTEKNFPTGGFPPLFICDFAEKKKEEINKNREFLKKDTNISIIDILKKKNFASIL